MKEEFDRQIKNLLEKGYPKAAGISEGEFIKTVEPFFDKLDISGFLNEPKDGYLPFVIVVKQEMVPVKNMLGAISWEGKSGVSMFNPGEIETFVPIKDPELPESSVYLLVDIDRGKETLNLAPDKAMEIIRKQKRLPLTVDEGLAIVTQYPEFLKKNNCFSLLGSRCGDKRVPAIWISEKRAKLGWCWAGNPHTWLGSASAKIRIS